MKVRMGFVSNSSSSSFMICIGSDIKTELYKRLDETDKKIADILFKDKESFSTLFTMSGEMGEGFMENFYEDTKDILPELYESVDTTEEDSYYRNYEFREIVQETVDDIQYKISKIISEIDPKGKDYIAEHIDM